MLDHLQNLPPEVVQEVFASPLRWAETFLVTPNSGKPFEPNYVESLILSSEHRFNVIRVHRRAGKCVRADELITLSDGSRIAAGELIGTSFELLTLTEDGIKPVPAFAEFNAIEPVYRLTTETGKTISRNAEHPLYVCGKQSTRGLPKIGCSGWVELKKIKIGDYVAVPIELPCESQREIPECHLKLLAYMIGDGGTTGGSTVFTQQSNRQLDEFIMCAEAIGCTVKNTGYLRYNITGKGGTRKGCNPLTNLLRDFSLFRCHSRDKHIPGAVFQLTKAQIGLFLSRLYSTDGWACTHNDAHRQRGEIGICFANESLVREVQELLLRFGICGSIRKKPKVHAWSLIIDNCLDVIAFADQIGIYGKEDAVEKARSAAHVASRFTTRKGTEVRHEENGTYVKKWIRPDGRTRYLRHTPWRLKNCPPGMRWERVNSIEYDGISPTVAISVPEYHTYLTTFYEHNSWALSTLALYHALTMKGAEVLVICPDGSKVATIFDRIREFIQANAWITPHVDQDRQNLPQRVTFRNGSKITGFTTAAKTKGEATALRSQGADVILIDEAAYLGEGDWSAIQPIMTGDMYRRRKTRVYVASTPAYTRGRYYNLCMDAFQKKTWNEIFVPITTNPSVTPEFFEECRATCPNEMDWRKEYLAEFPELGEGVFPKTLVDRAIRNFDYHSNLTHALQQTLGQEQAPTRTIGVDWDKYNKDGHGSTIVVLESTGPGRYRLIYREEIQQSEFTLKNAVTRLIELNDIFRPEWVFIDKGYGEMQFEELQLFGKRFPKTGLLKKVVSVQFAESVECPLPGGGVEKKRFKQAMVSLLRTWFENQWIEISAGDNSLRKDLIEYHVKGQTDSNIKYSDENDHCLVAGTLILTSTGEIPIEQVLPGMRVLTRIGWCDVLSSRMTKPEAPVFTVQFSNGAILTGTDNHPVWSETRNEFVPLIDLRHWDIMKVWNQIELPSTACISTAILTPRLLPTETITRRISMLVRKVLATFTRRFGKQHTETYLKDSRFTTGTATTSITNSTTLSVSQRPSTVIDTEKSRVFAAADPSNSDYCLRFDPWPVRNGRSGRARMRVEPSCPSGRRSNGERSKASRSSVRSVAATSSVSRVVQATGFVRNDVSENLTSVTRPTRKVGSASSVVTSSESFGVVELDSVAVHVVSVEPAGSAPVYNLTIDGAPEYFANGILVHNSIAALGLAAMAMHHKVKNPYLSPPAVKSYSVPAPVSVSTEALKRHYGKDYRRNPLLGNRPEFDTGDTFARRTLGDALPHSRSQF